MVMPAVARRTGGIAMVGRSLMRLMDQKCREGLIDYRVLSIHGPENDAERRQLDDWVGTHLANSNGRRGPFSVSVLWRMATWADQVVFMHVGLASLLSLLPKRLQPPSMTFIYGLEVWSPLPLRKRRGLILNDRVLTITQFTARKAREVNPWLPPTECCHLGVSAQTDSQPVDLEAELGFHPTRRDVVIVGRMAKDQAMKGHRQLIAAMDDVVNAAADARLLIVGTGDDTDNLKALARGTSAADRILFAGYVPDPVLWELYRRVGVFAMPSRQDGFGLVYLEAMRAGLPCVGSQDESAAEVIVDGQTGYLVDPDDRQDLAGALTRVLTDPELRNRLGTQGRSRFLEQFTEESFHQRFWQTLEPMLG